MREPRAWRVEKRRAVYEHPLITIAELAVAPEPNERDSQRSADAEGVDRTVVSIESNDWVNIVAVEESEDEPRLVLIRQWRFGCGAQTLEIPGGLVDDDERPVDAARRELLEETGFACSQIERLGVIQPNPALFNNCCHLYLARDLVHQGPPQGDGDEEIEVLLRPLCEVPRAVADGEIQHALVIAALHFFDLWRCQPGNQANAGGEFER